MIFTSILFPFGKRKVLLENDVMFRDLNLNQIFSAIEKDYEEYKLHEIFLMPLIREEEIKYRQEIMRDIDTDVIYALMRNFSDAMKSSRSFTSEAEKSHDINTAAVLEVQAIYVYVEAVLALQDGLSVKLIKAEGCKQLTNYLKAYTGSEEFQKLRTESCRLKGVFEEIFYTLGIQGNEIEVKTYEHDPDLTQIIEDFFSPFSQKKTDQAETADQKSGSLWLNHIETQIVGELQKIYPDIFESLHIFYETAKSFRNAVIVLFDEEVQFYLAYKTCMDKMRMKGTDFTYPLVSASNKNIFCKKACDLSLQLVQSEKIVGNTFFFEAQERIMIVTGPNQGGKTTFARMIGQLSYLASLGIPIPANEAKFFLHDYIFTHFEKQERELTKSGKLQDDIIRIYDILQKATDKSLLIINEMFASTTLKDALEIGQKVMQQISERDLLCVYVTFLEELSVFNEKTVSVVSQVQPDGETRSYQVTRQKADGRAYAVSIARRYGLTKADIEGRIRR